MCHVFATTRQRRSRGKKEEEKMQSLCLLQKCKRESWTYQNYLILSKIWCTPSSASLPFQFFIFLSHFLSANIDSYIHLEQKIGQGNFRCHQRICALWLSIGVLTVFEEDLGLTTANGFQTNFPATGGLLEVGNDQHIASFQFHVPISFLYIS